MPRPDSVGDLINVNAPFFDCYAAVMQQCDDVASRHAGQKLWDGRDDGISHAEENYLAHFLNVAVFCAIWHRPG